MAWEKPNLQTIIDRLEAGIEARLTDNISILNKAVIRVLIYVFGAGIYLCYGFIDYISKQIFVLTSDNEYLDDHAEEWGISRKSGGFASGNVRFTGVNNSFIDIDIILQDENGLRYTTKDSGFILNGNLDLSVEAEETGDEYNLSISDRLNLISPIPGVDNEVNAITNFTGGVSKESDDQLRDRILDRKQNPPSGGSITDYIRWAEEVSEVDEAWCKRQTPRTGAVTVIIKPYGGYEASTVLLNNVYNYISQPDRLPVACTLYVESIISEELFFQISISPNNEENRDLISVNFDDVIKASAEPDCIIYLSDLRNAIYRSGVRDYEITNISKGGVPISVDNIEFTGLEYPVFSNIIFSDM